MLLRQYLEKNRITIKEFAERIGIGRPHLNRVVCGTVKPGRSLTKLIELETKGNVKASDFEKEPDHFNIHRG